MQLQSKNLNKLRALIYTIWKYFFKEYFEFGSVSPFWIVRVNVCDRGDFIRSGINWQYIPTNVRLITDLRDYKNKDNLQVKLKIPSPSFKVMLDHVASAKPLNIPNKIDHQKL